MTSKTGKLVLAFTAVVLTASLSASQTEAAEQTKLGALHPSNFHYPAETVLNGDEAALDGPTTHRLLHRQKQGKWSLSSFSNKFEVMDFQDDVVGLKLEFRL